MSELESKPKQVAISGWNDDIKKLIRIKRIVNRTGQSQAEVKRYLLDLGLDADDSKRKGRV